MLISIQPFKYQSTSCKQRTRSRMAMCSKTPRMTHFSLSRKSSQRTQPTTSHSTMQMKVKIGRLVVYPSDDGVLSNAINITAAKACWKSVLKLVSFHESFGPRSDPIMDWKLIYSPTRPFRLTPRPLHSTALPSSPPTPSPFHRPSLLSTLPRLIPLSYSFLYQIRLVVYFDHPYLTLPPLTLSIINSIHFCFKQPHSINQKAVNIKAIKPSF